VREHGFARDGVVCLKADLFNRGGEILRKCKSVFLTDGREFPLAKDPAPHGGSWGLATGILFYFAEKNAPPLKSEVGLPRQEFPELIDGVYLCDLLGLPVYDEKDRKAGEVSAYSDNAGSMNLVISPAPKAKTFEVPLAWVDMERFLKGENDRLIVEGIQEWEEIS
jgi:hypothetical protein